jgi:hypothetical protein
VASKKRAPSPRFRVGKGCVYLHHGTWWLYYREHGRPVRTKVLFRQDEAEKVGAQVNAQVTSGSPTFLSLEPISVRDPRHFASRSNERCGYGRRRCGTRRSGLGDRAR